MFASFLCLAARTCILNGAQCKGTKGHWLQVIIVEVLWPRRVHGDGKHGMICRRVILRCINGKDKTPRATRWLHDTEQDNSTLCGGNSVSHASRGEPTG